MATVWVYNVGRDYLIVKRTPFAYQKMRTDRYMEIQNGVEITLPKWDWVQAHEGYIFAGFSGNIYEISDVS